MTNPIDPAQFEVAQDKITFFNLYFNNGKALSPHTRATRYALGVKGLTFHTEWVEVVDIPTLYDHLNVELNTDPTSFTLPVIYDPSTETAIADSLKIAMYLDEVYPTNTSLVPDEQGAELAQEVKKRWSAVDKAAIPLLMSRAMPYITKKSEVYFRTPREAFFGKKLEEIFPADEEAVKATWAAVRVAVDGFNEWYKTDVDALISGEEHPSYGDTYVAGRLYQLRVLGGEGVEWDDLVTWHGGRWAKLLEHFDSRYIKN